MLNRFIGLKRHQGFFPKEEAFIKLFSLPQDDDNSRDYLETDKEFHMWDYKNEGSNYDRAVDGGDETFHDYMIERCGDSSFDWNSWDKATGDGYGRHN